MPRDSPILSVFPSGLGLNNAGTPPFSKLSCSSLEAMAMEAEGLLCLGLDVECCMDRFQESSICLRSVRDRPQAVGLHTWAPFLNPSYWVFLSLLAASGLKLAKRDLTR